MTATPPKPWQPLPKGVFTGTNWSQPGATAGEDPYLIWAESDHFAGYRLGHGHKPPKWVPIVIELTAQASVQDLVDASSTRWLQIPKVYVEVNLPTLRYCTARVRSAFFKHLRHNAHLRSLIQRYELGLPVGHHTHAIKNPCSKDGLTHLTQEAPSPGDRLTGKVLGVIDGGLAVANATFRRKQGTGATRVQYFWRQDNYYGGPWPGQATHGHREVPLDPERAGPIPDDMGYGHELTGAAIDEAIAQFTHNGQLDEEALYAYLQMWDLSRPVNHGTHVTSLAAGAVLPLNPQHDEASRVNLVAVQLDWSNVLDTSGGAMNVSVLDGLMFILARCADSAQVVVNISWGTLAGPHDGSSILEAAMDQLIELRNGQLKIAVPAGNAYQSRTHANATLQPGQSLPLNWRVQPDDHTESFLELWLQDGAEGVEIAVTPPGYTQALPVVRMGQSGLWMGEAHSQGSGAEPVCALIFPTSSALGTQGTCALLALAPTFSHRASVTTAPFGRWQVTLTNHGENAVTLDAYIERDDVALGQNTGAKQPYFEDALYDTSGNLEAWVDHPGNPTPIRRSGTFNSLSTGQRTVSVGGTRREADPTSPVGPFALYSPQKPDPDAGRPQRPGVKKVPDTLKPSDDNSALWGVLGTGSLSGSVVRLAGTSSSSPQLARDLINDW
ncbi:hypothetical protein J2W49_000580 [Hydrogenophaga palleronii]|uniref:Peptidase S8/S53 domain-containing protein n=1 Tax=Hydrogenophaga palleronii TaxID=65655 RepID=A0ABU1WI34_9BURK|nr:hypothetical protein [Hydrogenophaga palleronii]MDR7148652.1 hypothetical protein [Hydrogenophaga palleronii]